MSSDETTPQTIPIPQPPGLPLLGNSFDIDNEFPLGSMVNFADQYGEFFRLNFPGSDTIFVTTQALLHELCDEKRFQKSINNALHEIRHAIHDGLFSAHNDEPNWGIAHRILMPAFGPRAIQNMFPEMHEIASQLALKWARHGPNQSIMVTDDFTRLTLDTIALCSMDYRFNSYYHDDLHPFIDAMGSFLTECGNRSRRPPLPGFMYSKVDAKFFDDIRILRETAEGVLKSRREHPSERKDLLTAMLDGVDPKTGAKLSDDTIIDNLITFLIAGHETTSGLLSFAFVKLLKNPETYRKAQKEVDDVCGKGPIKLEHMNKLPYITAVLRETLRLCPTIPVIGVESLEDTVIGGKYAVSKGQHFSLLFAKSQIDPAVYGDTANDFIPERMLDENFERLNKEFPDAWKPFGIGMRACIGRAFAWQEALLMMAVCLQNFNFVLEDPNYTLQYKQTLSTKPKDFYMRAILRDGMSALDLERRLKGELVAPKPTATQGPISGQPKKSGEGKPISIYYGSNTGTCESFARRLASDAEAHGFTATIIDHLDAANQNLPKDRPVVVITASYEGQPPDNAALFVGWLESLTGNELEGVQYAVFGCGHHDWAQTFHRIPELVDKTVSERGGDRICSLGLADAGKGEMFTEFEQWEDEVFWPAMEDKYEVSKKEDDTEALLQSGLAVEFSKPRSSTLRQDVQESVVVDVKTITAPGAPPKRHIEIKLSSDSGAYRSGDYLAVLPINPKETVNRVMRRFQLAWDTNMTIEASRQTTILPTGVPVPVHDVLGAYVELSQPATKKNILALAEAADNAEIKATLRQLAGPDYTEKITSRRVSILDLLEQFPSIPLPFASFLSLLPPMRVRQYSISSSPLWNPSHVTLTYSILETPSLSNPDKKHVGVATSYLASLEPGDKLNVSVRPSHKAFHLPVDADKTPLIMVAAGSGLAPFRGFVQERAAQITAGRSLAPAMLFYGCRHPEQDDLYRDEFDKWESIGAVSVRRAFSRCPESEETKGCKYVGDRIWADREEVTGLWDRGAKVYVCGSREVGESVKQVVVRIAVEMQRMIVEAREKGELDSLPQGIVEGLKLKGWTVEDVEVSEERALKWFEGIRNERYATDVFD